MRASRRPSITSFGVLLALVAVAAFAIRVVYLQTVAHHVQLGYDAVWYTFVADPLAHGKGVIDPAAYFQQGREIVTASHAPLYSVFLAGVIRLFNGDLATLRMAGALAGTSTVVLTGFIGRRIGGPAVGVVAAGLVAVFPSLIAVDGALMSETVAIPLLLGAVWAALVAGERMVWWRYTLVGVLLGLTILARADAVIVAVCVIVAMAMTAVKRWSRRLAAAGIAIVGATVVVMPWVVRNQTDLGRAVVATTSTSRTIAGANCESAYHGSLAGNWDAACAADKFGIGAEMANYDDQMSRGLDYARGHLTQLPAVVVLRELREFGLYAPRQQARLEAIETRSYHWQLFAWAAWLPAMILGIAGFVVMFRRRVPGVWTLFAVVVSVVLVAALSHGNQRFRTACEPVVLVAAAYALVAAWSAVRARRAVAHAGT